MADNKTLRADAQANRNRILDVARDALTHDPLTSLNLIARAAGVGAGTLYRHFPSRESLVLGVYHKEIDVLVTLAPALLTKHPPLQAFHIWCDQFANLSRMKYGIADILHAAGAEQSSHETYERMLGAVRRLTEACEGSGAIRPGTDPEDFLVLLGLFWRIPPDAAGEARVKRLLALAFRGLEASEKTAESLEQG